MKKIFLTLVIVLACEVMASAQLSFGKSSIQVYVESAVQDAMFVSSHSFLVRNNESQELFGYKTSDYFDKLYGIGIKVQGGIILPDMVVNPWDYAPDFKQYKDEYSPQSRKKEYSVLDNRAKFDTLSFAADSVIRLKCEDFHYLSSDTFKGEGLTIDNTPGTKDGWVIWLLSSGTGELPDTAATVSLKALRKEISVPKNQELVDAGEPASTLTPIGGIYVVPIFDKVGIIEFKLCGILTERDDKWQLLCPFVGMETEPVEKGTLQPIGSEVKPAEDPEGDSTDENPEEGKQKKNKKGWFGK